MKFIFLGPPGAGKGTLAAKIATEYTIPHISTGDIFRKAIKEKTPLGLQVQAILDAGSLVSDEITTELVRERLLKDDTKNGYILDGFPRTIPQAQTLATFEKADFAVNFEIADDAVIQRLSGRRVCKSCGQNFHVQFLPPKKAGLCDSCGGELFTREDDKREAIIHRLEVYRNQTAPIIDFYRHAKVLVTIDASPDTQTILKDFHIKFPRKSQ